MIVRDGWGSEGDEDVVEDVIDDVTLALCGRAAPMIAVPALLAVGVSSPVWAIGWRGRCDRDFFVVDGFC